MPQNSGQTILADLRRRGLRVRRALSGKLEASSSTGIPYTVKEEIQTHREAILQALEQETAKAVRSAEEKAQDLLVKGKTKRAVVTVEHEGTVFIACRRTDGPSWVIGVPEEAYDPWRLAAIIVASAQKEDKG